VISQVYRLEKKYWDKVLQLHIAGMFNPIMPGALPTGAIGVALGNDDRFLGPCVRE